MNDVAMTSEQAAALADADPWFAAVLADLPKAWAQWSADEDELPLVSAFLRAAYGRGYVAALEREEP